MSRDLHANTPKARPNANTYWVNEHLLAGEYPGHWDDREAQSRLAGYLAAGITFFIDLTQAGELKPYEDFLAIASGDGPAITYRRRSIRDADIPRSRHQMAHILDTIDQAIAEGHSVYVHCWGGIGRTGTVVGCYLVRHGLSGDEALARLQRLWQTVEKSSHQPSSPETQAQAAFVRAWKEPE